MALANNPKDRASAQFDKLQRAEDGKKSLSEYEAAAAAVRAKTERLRALRLAQEAAAGPAPTAAPAKAKPARARKKAAGSLSDFLKAERGSGRNT